MWRVLAQSNMKENGPNQVTEAKESSTSMKIGYLNKGRNQNKLASNEQQLWDTSIHYICEQPNMANVFRFSRKVSEPIVEEWRAVKRVIRYLEATIDFNLKFPISNDPKPIGYCIEFQIQIKINLIRNQPPCTYSFVYLSLCTIRNKAL